MENCTIQELGKEQYGKLCEKFRKARKQDMSIGDRVNLMMLEKENKLILREILKKATVNEKMEEELKECTFSPFKYSKGNLTSKIKLKRPFQERVRNWEEKKHMKLQKKKMENEIVKRKECTFQPRISKVKEEIMNAYPTELTHSNFLQKGLASHYDRMHRARHYHNSKQDGSKSRSTSCNAQRNRGRYSRSPAIVNRMNRSRRRAAVRGSGNRNVNFQAAKEELRKHLLEY